MNVNRFDVSEQSGPLRKRLVTSRTSEWFEFEMNSLDVPRQLAFHAERLLAVLAGVTAGYWSCDEFTLSLLESLHHIL